MQDEIEKITKNFELKIKKFEQIRRRLKKIVDIPEDNNLLNLVISSGVKKDEQEINKVTSLKTGEKLSSSPKSSFFFQADTSDKDKVDNDNNKAKSPKQKPSESGIFNILNEKLVK